MQTSDARVLMRGCTRRRIAVVTLNVVPGRNDTHKYERLGRMALINRRRYCERHGYALIERGKLPVDRPLCWAKIPALLAALDAFDWVLWADSDALTLRGDLPLEPLLDDRYDVIAEAPETYFDVLGLDRAASLEVMRINTGVFFVRATDWSRALLRAAFEETFFVSRGEIWDGIGDQEAILAVLARDPESFDRVGYVRGLQCPPRSYDGTQRFVHFYGNHADPLIPAPEAEEVLARWERSVQLGMPCPRDLVRFHWSCIQSRARRTVGRGPDYFFYDASEIVGSEPVHERRFV